MFGVYLESPEFVVMIMAAITIVLLKICVYNRHFLPYFYFFSRKTLKLDVGLISATFWTCSIEQTLTIQHTKAFEI